MMATVNPVSAVGSRQVGRSETLAASKAELSAEDFWQLLLTHLQMQDPFQTTDMNAMLQQFVALQAAREMARLSDAFQRMQAMLMLGRTVTAFWEGNEVSGTVVGVSLSGTPTLSLQAGNQTLTVPLSAVWEIGVASSSLSTQA